MKLTSMRTTQRANFECTIPSWKLEKLTDGIDPIAGENDMLGVMSRTIEDLLRGEIPGGDHHRGPEEFCDNHPKIEIAKLTQHPYGTTTVNLVLEGEPGHIAIAVEVDLNDLIRAMI